MRNKIRLLTAAILVTMSLVLVPSVAGAASLSVDCTEVHAWGTLAEGEQARLEVRLHDGPDWQDPVVQDDIILITDSGPFDVTVPWVEDPSGDLHRVVLYLSPDGGATWVRAAHSETSLTCPPPDGEGCTPGYWKNHLEDWPPTGYAPGDDFDTVFGVDLFDPDITLEQAVNANGGGVNKLARHGTAALLSASHPDVSYPYTVAEVIAKVQAGDVEPLVAANELGCSIP